MDLTSCYSNKVFCPCGVAVRAGADVFMINYCDRWSVTQFVSCEKEPVLQVTKQIGNNRNFRVRFPSGTAVFIQVVHLNPVNLLNLEIRPTASDVENSTGLCGTLSNTCTDDFKLSNGTTRYTDASCPNTVNKEFSESWRIRDDENLFKINNSSVFKTWHEQVSQSYCGCSTNDSVCVPKTLYPEICQDNGYEAVQTTCRESVGKSSFALTIPEKEIITHTLTEPLKPDKTNITKEEARSFCEWIMRNTSSLCSPVRNLHTEYFLEICVLDILSTNSKMWIAQTHDIMKARCVYEIQTNVSLQSNQTTSVETILSHLCPGSKVCSGHGACKNGICHCDDNYISNDCSVDITMPPIIFEIQYHGLCRFGFDSCRTVLVYGRNIHESKQMYCKISKIYVVKMEANTQEIIGSTVVIKAKTSSVMKIECDFTLATFTEIFTPYIISGYQVAVGYNNKNFTRAMKYYEYHRECQFVHGQDANRTFSIIDGTCFIDDQCYKHLDNNTNNEYEYCDSRLTKIEWSFDKENTCKINGTFYPKNERRGDNQCLLCNPALSPYNWTLDEDKCYIDSKCLQRNTKNPKDKDEFCNPDLDKFNWTFNESALQPEVRAHLEQVHQTLMNVDIEKLYFECYLDMSRLAYKLYEVTWNWGHNSILTLEANKTNLDKLRLTEDFFKTLGTHVNCTIQGKINSTDLSGTVFKSQSFFAGVVVEESMTIQKGQTANLRYHLTVPFGCLSIGNIYPPCFIELNMLSPEPKTTKSCSGDIVNLQHCRVKIYRDHWNSSFSLAIKHRGRQMYGVYPEMINLKLHTSSADHTLWDSTKIPNIKVNVIDVPKDLQQKVCSAYNAHLSTFDGLRYEHQHGGVFTLYHHRTADKYMMVQIQYAPCDESQNLFCICGVAVRAGGDIYVIIFCNGMNLIQYLSCQQKLLHVVAGEKDNKKYKVTLPSGTEVMVNVKYIGVRTFMTVEIRASDSDLGNTEGLCGTLNNNCSDDFTLVNGTTVKPSNQHCDTALDVHVESKIFSQHWSVKDDDDLFALDSRRSIELWNSYEEYCSCPSSAVSDNFECSPMSTVTCSQEKGYKTIGVSTCTFTNVTGLIRTRNSSEIIPEEKRRGNETITLLTAEEKCRSSIENSTAFISCSAVPNVPTEYFIKICALEVKTSGSLTWIDHTLNTLKVRCLSEVQWNGTLNSPTEDGRATVTETVILSLCPGNPECSGHGKCVEGVCVCDEGLMSDDCSMDKVLPPQIYSTRGEGVCDLNQINCDTAFVIGERIEESDEMSCKITKHILHPDGSQTFAGTTIVNGKLETLVEVHCPLTSTRQRRSANIGEVPFVEMFDVSVGYNKNNFSAPQRIYNINSKCQEKTGTDNDPEFKLKEKMCFIKKECYNHGDRRESKDLFYCDADEDPYNWSFNKTQSCLVEDTLYQKNENIIGRECLYCVPSISWFNWTLAEGYCILDGKCVRHNDKMSEDECMYCNSNLDKFGWTRSDEVCVKKVPQGTGDIHPTSSLAVILFSSVGAVVLVIVSVLTLNWYIKNKAGRKTKKYMESTEDQLSPSTDHVYHMPKARLR